MASGLASPSMTRGRGGAADTSQDLDAESASGLARLKKRDADIDQGVDAIGKTLDNLGQIAGAMKDEVTTLPLIVFFAIKYMCVCLCAVQVLTQGAKIERVENAMQKATEKQIVVNARQRKLVQSS